MSSLLVRDVRLVPIRSRTAPDAPVDVLVEGGMVTSVGPGLPRPPGVEEVAGDGRWCIPGLWDQHVHLTQWTLAAQRLDLSAARSPEDALAVVARQVVDAPGGPVIGWGHRSAGWSREASVTELDAVSGDTLVVLVSGDGHHGWVNSTGLRALDLPVRDSVVREQEWFAAYPRLGALTPSATSPAAFREVLDRAAALGVVGLVDFEFDAGLDEWGARWDQGCDRLRIRWATYAGMLDDVIAAGLRTGHPLPGCAIDGGDDRASMGPLKIISDGSLNTRTAWCRDRYATVSTEGDTFGEPNLDAEELGDLLARAHGSGLEVATHAIGDAALAQALTAYETTGARGSIEHAQLVGRDDVRRMAELGLRASVQPAHLLDDRDVTEQLWPDRTGRSFAFRWMLDGGVELALGSDAPVSPLDPWLAMAAAVHRSAEDREAWHPEQALTVAEALAASVDGQPTVGIGSRGDLVLLDRDPLAAEPGSAAAGSALRRMPVALTVVAGQRIR